MLSKALKDYNIQVGGIVHVGAHSGQEGDDYRKLTDNIIMIEPIPMRAQQLYIQGFDVFQMAAWDKNETLDFYVTDFDEGSSALKPIEHSVKEKITVEARKLKGVIPVEYNVIVVDTQGSELKVLRGADLKQFDVIVCETSERVRYEGAPSKKDIVKYLKDYEVVDVHYHSQDKIIQDNLFIKKELL